VPPVTSTVAVKGIASFISACSSGAVLSLFVEELQENVKKVRDSNNKKRIECLKSMAPP
jgi:hypothetical protein